MGAADGALRASAADSRRRRPDYQEQLAPPFQIPAQPAGLMARQCRRADRRLRHHALGTVTVCGAVEGHAAGSRENDDPADDLWLRGPYLLCLFLGTDGTAQRGWAVGVRRGRADHRGGLQLRLDGHGCVGVLADIGRRLLLCRWWL